MKTNHDSRRKFIGNIAAGAAVLGMLSVPSAVKAIPDSLQDLHTEDAWLKSLKGKHKMVFDVPHANEMLPFAWPRVFLMTNEATGTVEKMNNAVVVLRHSAIPYALNDAMWAKYKLGETFKIDDPLTQSAAIRNPFNKPKKGDFTVPGIGPVAIGINELQDSGVIFCVCNVALTVNSAVVAQKMQMDASTIKNEWTAGLLPGIKVVPSGVWAVGRAQENGFAYCFAG